MSSARLRKLTDLFAVGQAVPLSDGTYLWVQALNAYQRDEAVSDAQVARARLIMALREAGDERMKVEARFYEHGRDEAIDDLSTFKSQEKLSEYMEDIRTDPDWKERMDILLATDEDDTAAPLTPAEIALIAKLNQEFMDELVKREKDEKDYQVAQLKLLDDAALIEEWTDEWLERRGSELATGEYRLTEIAYAARYCNATFVEGRLDHSPCAAHEERIFETRQDVRAAPQELLSVIQGSLAELNVSGRDPKDSASPTSSSDSLPTPSEPEASTPSTSTGTPAAAPGI